MIKIDVNRLDAMLIAEDLEGLKNFVLKLADERNVSLLIETLEDGKTQLTINNDIESAPIKIIGNENAGLWHGTIGYLNTTFAELSLK